MVDSRKERSGEERSLSLEGLVELFARNARLVVFVVAASLAASLAWLESKRPVFRATATLILESEGAGGVLGELAALTQAPKASSEIELLRARTTAEQTVAHPACRPADEGWTRASQRSLGLTTLVEEARLKPLHELALGRDAGRSRLRARLDLEAEPAAEVSVRLTFLAPTRVRLAQDGLGARLGLGESSEAEIRPGEALAPGGAFGSLRLALAPEGDLTGREFVVRRLPWAEAVKKVLAGTRVRETERGSNVIELVVQDSDPERAAATANALCFNYLDRNEERGDKRASQTLAFIDEQLEVQMKALREAELDLVATQRDNPRAIAMGKAAEALIARISELEVERARSRLFQVSLRQALERLSEGGFEALSRLSVELADPITRTYVEGLARLSAEADLQERSDAGAYKTLLQGKSLEIEVENQALGLEIAAVAETLAAVREGDGQAVARLGAGLPLSGDPLLAGHLEALAGLQSRRAVLAGQFTAEHPDVAQVEAEILGLCGRIGDVLASRLAGLESRKLGHDALLASVRGRASAYPEHERETIAGAIQSLKSRTAAHLESSLAGQEARERSVGDEIGGLERELGALPEEERALADPLRRQTAHEEIVKFLLTRQQEAEIARASSVASADFIDPAAPPARRHGPSIPLHLLGGLVLGLAASVALAFAKETFRRCVFTAAELETVTALPVFGAIPDFRHGRYKVRGAGDNFVPLRDDPEGPAAEAYRSMRANLKFALSERGGLKVVGCTSCTPGEGKSMTNLGIALAFARGGKRVLLVDADLRRPSVHRYLGLELSPGLSDALEQRLPWRECVRPGVQERLDVICAGKHPRSPSDLLEGEPLERLLQDLREEYDLVVFDLPPALAVSETSSLASRLDALALVARSDKVPAHVLAETTARLRKAGAKLIGAVLNAVGTSLANGRYGYGYGYWYGYGSGQGRSSDGVQERRVAS